MGRGWGEASSFHQSRVIRGWLWRHETALVQQTGLVLKVRTGENDWSTLCRSRLNLASRYTLPPGNRQCADDDEGRAS